jgi:anti-sigma regulatory factor (Ser/Thr protein kinase)
VFVLELPASLESAADARRRLSAEIGAVPAAVAQDVRLMTTELITNAVRHGGLPDGARIHVRGYQLRDRIRIEVVHPGAGLPAGFRPPAPAMGETSGWGLVLVEHVADRWGTSEGSGDACVWFEIDLS